MLKVNLQIKWEYHYTCQGVWEKKKREKKNPKQLHSAEQNLILIIGPQYPQAALYQPGAIRNA